ncbi:hypothetical protein C7Q71_13570 [Staphylococcus aureus]|nr:hypothetical protein C7Q71_13570 [Staphylococcus aureus]PZJ18594.1 hypothetical protein C7Q40_14190 [Staphylococcus aureus]
MYLGHVKVLLGMFLSLKTLYRKRTVIWPFYFYTIIRTLSEFASLVHFKVKSFLYVKYISKTQITCLCEINTFILKDIVFLENLLINFEFLENLLNSKIWIVII